jgi:hypothetical protein
MATEYMQAGEAAELARGIIDRHHSHLATARVEFVFNKKTDKEGQPQFLESKGKRLLGRAKVVSGLGAYLAREDEDDGDEQFFVIELCWWSWQHMDEGQRLALLDHELCHCEVDLDTAKLKTITHDVEEFSAVVERHGLWWADVLRFTERAAKHLPLLDRQAEAVGRDESVPVITIDEDVKCQRCRKPGATPSGMCLGCAGKAIKAGEFDHVIRKQTGPIADRVVDALGAATGAK